MAAVSVVVATLNPGSALPRLVRSVDAQTLPAKEFEVVVVDASSDGSAPRLQQLAGRRPNVIVLAGAAEASAAERLGQALERATGEYVLVLGQRQQLAPRALELLLEAARRTGADLVLGRVVTATASGCAVLSEDAERLDASEVDPKGCLALVRRSLVGERPDAGAALLDLPALVREAGSVSAVGRYACATQGGPAAPGDEVSLGSPNYRWDGGMLQLTVPVQLGNPSPAPRAWLVAGQGLAEIALPATMEADSEDPARLTASAALDPRTAEGGGPLDDGPWELRLRLAWPDREVTLPVPPGPSRSAVLAGRPYVAHTGNRVLEVDAGATRTSVIGPVPRSRTSIAESARGILVTFDYPSLHAPDEAVLDAGLLLDGFAMPGRLVCQGGRARLEVYASSLAGTSLVAVVAGGGRPVPTGLRLRVDGKGAMSFVNAPASRRPQSGQDSGNAPLAQRLRRHLPGALEPTVQRLAQVPALRDAYRRLINR